MDHETLASPFTYPSDVLQRAEVLDKPVTLIDENAVLKVYAVSEFPVVGELRAPVGFVSTKTTRVQWLGEFSGKPTGRSSPCNAVKGFVGENVVYSKAVTKDTALSGLRTALAQFRAARTVKSRLKG